MILLALLLACATEPPVPLPAPEAKAPPVDARMVRAAAVQGFLGRPGSPGPEAVLLLVEAQGEATRARVRELAEGGAITLAVGPEVEPAAARAYLAGMSGVGAVRTLCERAACPEEVR